VKRATGEFLVRLNTGEEYEGGQGMKISVNDLFTFVTWRNESLASIEITFYVGDDDVEWFADSTIKDAATYNVGTGIINLQGGGAKMGFIGSDNGNQRRQITIQNLDDTTPVNVFSSDAHLCAQVPPGQAWTMATSGYVGIGNSSANVASVVPCVVLETFYQP
jgi:hypothetical protein